MYLRMEKFLPEEIKLDIFSRLPVESVIQLKQVCKTWRTLLHHPDFPLMHLRRRLMQLDDDANPNGFLLRIRLGSKYDFTSKLCYQEYDENWERLHKPLVRTIHPRVHYCHHIGSCCGLVYKSLVFNYSLGSPKYGEYIYICNPLNGEYVILPRFSNKNATREGLFQGHIAIGFGYLPSTNEYKVVRIYCPDNSYPRRLFEQVYAEVYTIGSGNGWTKIEYSPSLPHDIYRNGNGVLANGALHWIGNQGKIVYFDLADEKFRLLPSPPYQDEYDIYELKVFRRQLCLFHRKEYDNKIDIWLFKKSETSATNNIKDQEYQSWRWSSISIALMELEIDDYCALIAITKSGDILLSYHKSGKQAVILYRYDPKA